MLMGSRDFLMFMPQEATLKTIYSYYLSAVSVNPEGDVSLSDEMNPLGLGKGDPSLWIYQVTLVVGCVWG
jgi:hypothetical protein